MACLSQLSADLSVGKTSSRSLLNGCLEHINDPTGEGDRVYLRRYKDKAIVAAEIVDKARKLGHTLPAYAGIPISIKDLFDVEGETTQAGSTAFDALPAAEADAGIVGKLKQAGFVIVGKTNMTEFAYSGLGINPHFGTPLNPYDRETGRIPGGSTSGGAVSVTDQMAFATIGTDTGGSCRIPAALSGIVGFKPTSSRVSKQGVFPLSPTQDAVGPLANTVISCAILDAILADEPKLIPDPHPVNAMCLGLPQHYVLNDLEDHVAAAFQKVIDLLIDAGASIIDVPFKELERLPEINRNGGFVGAEAYAIHRPYLEQFGDRYDPWIRNRFQAGQVQTAADYVDLCRDRRELMQQINAATQYVDAVIAPTVAITAPPINEIADDAEYSMQVNRLLLRNTSIANFLDRCAISIPCHGPDTAPVGLMLLGDSMADRKLFGLALSIEALITSYYK